mmetsp:Transcript_68543/g.108789  ORF Transcript_68543/g.108789 Transcript_68543/m.108789 type:complete len:162 (-) Transcript_68543:43-528(-)
MHLRVFFHVICTVHSLDSECVRDDSAAPDDVALLQLPVSRVSRTKRGIPVPAQTEITDIWNTTFKKGSTIEGASRVAVEHAVENATASNTTKHERATQVAETTGYVLFGVLQVGACIGIIVLLWSAFAGFGQLSVFLACRCFGTKDGLKRGASLEVEGDDL